MNNRIVMIAAATGVTAALISMGHAQCPQVCNGDNTALGVSALASNASGGENTAIGYLALFSNVSGDGNTAVGQTALVSNTGDSNTAVGFAALVDNTTGTGNTALGNSALAFHQTGSNNIDIGNLGANGDSSRIRIGSKGKQRDTYIAGINGVTVAGGIGVIIDGNGHLGTTTSSARFKTQIHPMGHDSDPILSMQPVSFRYKKEVADNSVAQFGLVAEEVEKVAPDLVVRDDDGKPYSVRYEAVNAMLLNEFLKEHEKVEAQKKALEEQANTIQRLEAGLEKVNARLDANGL